MTDLKTLREVATQAARRNWTDADRQEFDDAFRPSAVLALLDRIEELEGALTTLQGERDRLREALTFYRDEWRANADGDMGEAHLTRTWMEPTDALFDDAGHKARTALHPEPSTEQEGAHG
jgi:hypothetical protein